MTEKIKVATASLCGCFGCHMSLLDIDERILDLVQLVEFDRSPITDIKTVGDCDIGIIEGGVANAENVEVLREFREHSKILVALGACAVNGGIPAMRNQFPLEAVFDRAYRETVDVNPLTPSNRVPELFEKVRPVHGVVDVDVFVPGCPPSADAIWYVLNELIAGRDDPDRGRAVFAGGRDLCRVRRG